MTIEEMLRLTEAIGDQAVRHTWHQNISGAILALVIVVVVLSGVAGTIWFLNKRFPQ